VRDDPGLSRLLTSIEALEVAHGRSAALVAARLIAAAAVARTESRGGHFRADHPETVAPRRTFITLAELDAPAVRYAAE
jgi:L-aspartate oxidase